MVLKRGKIGKIGGLSIQFIPYSDIRELDGNQRIKKILEIILNNNMIILQGKLKPEEEARLIGDTMVMIGRVPGFKGVELAVINGTNGSIYGKMRQGIASAIAGTDTGATTIIGPATIIKEIKRNPKKIELLFK